MRRVFSRSDMRKKIIDEAIVKDYKDPKRKAVKFWIKCEECENMEAKSNIQLDHVSPVVPITSSLVEMEIEELADRIWCEEKNLRKLCLRCHSIKTKAENKERREYKKRRKNNEPR